MDFGREQKEEKMMKKYIKKCIVLLLVVVMAVCLACCQSKEKQQGTEDGSMSAENEQLSADGESMSADDESVTASVKTVSDGDLEMDYIIFGSGEKNFVILPGLSVHSVMGSADVIADAYKSFAKDYTVYVFDRAKNIQDGYTVEDMADDTAKAMKALNIEDADIFGASQGGMIAQYLAIDHPDLVHKMILGSTLAKPNDTFKKITEEWVSLAEEKDETGLLESFVDYVYSDATLKEYRDTIISSNSGISDEEFERFRILTSACRTFDCYDELSSVSCPVLVLGSEGDRVVTAEGSRQIAEALGCEIYLYDDSYGHGVYDEAPDYRQRCLDFFEKE